MTSERLPFRVPIFRENWLQDLRDALYLATLLERCFHITGFVNLLSRSVRSEKGTSFWYPFREPFFRENWLHKMRNALSVLKAEKNEGNAQTTFESCCRWVERSSGLQTAVLQPLLSSCSHLYLKKPSLMSLRSRPFVS